MSKYVFCDDCMDLTSLKEENERLKSINKDMREALESIRKHCEEREQWNDDPVRFAAIANKALAKAGGEL